MPVPPLPYAMTVQQSDQAFAQAMQFAQAGRLAEALSLIEQAAEAGHPDALFALGDAWWRGIGVPQDLVRGRELFRRSAVAGQPMGVRAYTNLLASGIAGERGWAEALRRLADEARTDGLRARILAVIEAMELDRNGDPIALPDPEQLSEEPGVWLYRGIFSEAECDFLRLLAEPTYERSLVKIDGQDVPDTIRTSDGSAIHWLIEDPATHAINRRLAAMTRTAVEQGEPLYVLRYRPGQQYHPHVDWLDEPNRRILSALTYLNDDYAGGETRFVKAGLDVRGHKGDTLVFRNIASDGGFDPLSEHEGLPVTSGTKYLASRWIRERRHSP